LVGTVLWVACDAASGYCRICFDGPVRIFGAAADSYHTFRPGYPPQIAVDLAARLTGRRVVEVGAGTGKFTRTLLALGCEVTCVEPDPAVAARLTAMLGDRVTVEVTPFEEWSGSGFDALVSAQAWHWVTGEDRYRRVSAALKPGGEFAAVWNDFFPGKRWMADLVNGVYRRLGLELLGHPA
jgi:SAM-dependent methyltransferase